MARVRKMVSFQPVWDTTLIWYERAVAAMATRPVADVTSWAYQAAIHGTTRRGRRRAWNSCEHGGWFFFPWHRGYLAAFEQIVLAEVKAQGGPDDWALPYWDYERPGRSALPPAFRSPTRPDGRPNALFTDQRLAQVNAGMPLQSLLEPVFGPTAKLSSAAGLAEPTFSTGRTNGFGGGPTPSSFQADRPGDIESFLHGNVHVLVGLGGGWMSGFRTAAQDPVFWLHHANIDRLWALWASRAGHANPTGRWRTQSWTYFAPDTSRLTRTPADVVDTTAQLDYRYDSVPGRRTGPAPGPIVGAMPDEPGADLEPVGWSGDVTLAGHAVDAAVVVDRATVGRVAGPGAFETRTYLELSEIEAEEAPGILYGVYLQPVTGADEPSLVGVVSFFGAEDAGRGRGSRHHHRLRYVFDVTDTLAALGVSSGADWADEVTVSFRPLGPAQLPDAAGAFEPDMPPVTIGRVALLMG